MSERNITKETRTRSAMYKFDTLKLVNEFIYQETGCTKCRRGKYCSRDGDKWACCSYASIAEHLMSIGRLTSRGNTRWSATTVREQIEWRKKTLSPEEKKLKRKQQDREREANVEWVTHTLTDGSRPLFDAMLDEAETITVDHETDIDVLLDTIRSQIETTLSHDLRLTIATLRVR